MDILDAVTTWLEQKKNSGTDKIYLNQASKTQLTTFLDLTRDENKLNMWLVENNKTSHEIPAPPTEEPTLSLVPTGSTADPIQDKQKTIIEKPAPKNSEIMAKEPEISQILPDLTDLPEVKVIKQTIPPTDIEHESTESQVKANQSDYIFLKQLSSQTKILIIGEQLYHAELSYPFQKSKVLLQGMIMAMDNFIKKNMSKEIDLPWEAISLVEVCKKSYTDQDNMAYIQDQLSQIITVVQPEVILLMGALPTVALTGANNSVLNIHGQWFNFQNVACMPTFHPDFLNRAETRKKEAWADLQKVIKFLSDRRN